MSEYAPERSKGRHIYVEYNLNAALYYLNNSRVYAEDFCFNEPYVLKEKVISDPRIVAFKVTIPQRGVTAMLMNGIAIERVFDDLPVQVSDFVARWNWVFPVYTGNLDPIKYRDIIAAVKRGEKIVTRTGDICDRIKDDYIITDSRKVSYVIELTKKFVYVRTRLYLSQKGLVNML